MGMQKKLEQYLGWCVKKTVHRDKPRVLVIAGSVGKTSARYALSVAMSRPNQEETYRASQKNYNNELGVPLSVFACDMPGRSVAKWFKLLYVATAHALGLKRLKVKWLILEIAADHPGDLDYLLGMLKPNVAIMTSMGAEHTEYFGTVEAAIEEERKVLLALSEEGEALLNADDAATWESRHMTKAEVIGFGKSQAAAVRIRNIQTVYDFQNPGAGGLDVEFEVLRNHVKTIRLRGVYGEAHAYAVAASLTFLLSLDQGLEMAMDYIQDNYVGMPGRTRIVPGIKGTVLLDDSYNAQPQAMSSALRDLARFPVSNGGRRIAVLGDMLELGELTEQEHEIVGKLVVETGVDLLVTCGKYGKLIGEAAANAGMPSEKVFMFDASPDAGLFLQQEIIKPGDAILVKGSQSIRMEKITKELMSDPLEAASTLVRQTPDWLAK